MVKSKELIFSRPAPMMIITGGYTLNGSKFPSKYKFAGKHKTSLKSKSKRNKSKRNRSKSRK